MEQMRTAAAILIGNELLSGRTKDANLPYFGEKLNRYGIRLCEARVIADDEQTIVDTVNLMRKTYDYVFTTGGIGPTHDDITSACVAKAFDVPLTRNAEAVELLKAHYDEKGQELTSARLKMADVPEGSELIYNIVSAAPGFIIGNVHVMAGVPSIMRAMLDSLEDKLSGGPSMLSETIELNAREGDIADKLTEIQGAYPDIEIGCYPKFQDGVLSCSLVLRSLNEAAIADCAQKIRQAFL